MKEKNDGCEDIINRPNHYHKNNIDVIKFSEMQFDRKEMIGFCRVNALKYITRYDRKNGIQDLEKSKFYINKLIDYVIEEERKDK